MPGAALQGIPAAEVLAAVAGTDRDGEPALFRQPEGGAVAVGSVR